MFQFVLLALWLVSTDIIKKCFNDNHSIHAWILAKIGPMQKYGQAHPSVQNFKFVTLKQNSRKWCHILTISQGEQFTLGREILTVNKFWRFSRLWLNHEI